MPLHLVGALSSGANLSFFWIRIFVFIVLLISNVMMVGGGRVKQLYQCCYIMANGEADENSRVFHEVIRILKAQKQKNR